LIVWNDAIFPDPGLGSFPKSGAGRASFETTGTIMAYILRSLAVIGVIALNSPVHGERSDASGTVATVRNVARAAAQIDAHGAMSSITAAREAAQILAGLDPETRQRVMALTAAAVGAKNETRERGPAIATR
jgi:hypothetical protein